MKKLYILAVLLIAGAISLPAAPRHAPVAKRIFKPAAKSDEASHAEIWCPATQQMFLWEGEWILTETNNYTYNSMGLATEDYTVDGDNEGATRIVYTYNDNGNWKTRESQSSSDLINFRNSEKTVREFDAVVPGFVTATYGYNWLNYEWQQTGNNWEREVTRDTDGNVTKVERRVLYNGIFDPTQRFFVEYGADGKASKLWSEELTSNGFNLYWEEGDVYTDIVWERTDGQILSDEDLMYGANRISSAKVISDGDELSINVEYRDELGSFKGEIKGLIDGMEVTSVIEHTVCDIYGSYDEVITETYTFEGESETTVATNRYRTDDFGLDLLVYVSESFGGEEEIFEWIKGDITRDSQNRPTEYIQQIYNYDTEEFENSMRILFSDYIDAAGVSQVTTDDVNSQVELFDLSGMPVHGEAAPGVYIRRQGSRISKILVK